MIRRILLPLDPSAYSESAMKLAKQIAKKIDAEITGLVILDVPGIESSIGPVPLGGGHFADKLEKEKVKDAHEHIEKLLEKFKSACEADGIRYHAAELQGRPSEQIISESIYYDLVVIGLKTFFHFETSGKAGNSLDHIIGQTITPIYGAPENVSISDNPNNKNRVLIAFDGSLLSARALQRFCHLADPDLVEITLLNASGNRGESMALLEKAQAYLNAHGIMDVHKEWADEDIVDLVASKYYKRMDAFVVGAHARQGLLDFMVGSLTKYLIRKAEKPVFIG